MKYFNALRCFFFSGRPSAMPAYENFQRLFILISAHAISTLTAFFAAFYIGVDDFGLFNRQMSLSVIISTIVILGSYQILLRSNRDDLLQISIFSSIVGFAIAVLVMMMFVATGGNQQTVLVAHSLSMLYITSAIAQNFKKFNFALFLRVLLPAGLTASCIAILIVKFDKPYSMIGIVAPAIWLSSAILLVVFLMSFPKGDCKWDQCQKHRFRRYVEMLKGSLRIFMFSVSFVVVGQLDVVALGLRHDDMASGWYGLAARLAGLSTLGHLAVTAFVPRLIVENLCDQRKLQAILSESLRFSVAIFAFATLGSGLYVAYVTVVRDVSPSLFMIPFVILAFGAFINVATGPCGFLLTMSNNDRTAAYIAIAGAIADILLFLLALPSLSSIEAATITAMATGSIYVAMAFCAKEKTGVDATILGLRRQTRDA